MESCLLCEAVFHTITDHTMFLSPPRGIYRSQGILLHHRAGCRTPADAPLLDGALGSLTWWVTTSAQQGLEQDEGLFQPHAYYDDSMMIIMMMIWWFYDDMLLVTGEQSFPWFTQILNNIFMFSSKQNLMNGVADANHCFNLTTSMCSNQIPKAGSMPKHMSITRKH